MAWQTYEAIPVSDGQLDRRRLSVQFRRAGVLLLHHTQEQQQASWAGVYITIGIAAVVVVAVVGGGGGAVTVYRYVSVAEEEEEEPPHVGSRTRRRMELVSHPPYGSRKHW